MLSKHNLVQICHIIITLTETEIVTRHFWFQSKLRFFKSNGNAKPTLTKLQRNKSILSFKKDIALKLRTIISLSTDGCTITVGINSMLCLTFRLKLMLRDFKRKKKEKVKLKLKSSKLSCMVSFSIRKRLRINYMTK